MRAFLPVILHCTCCRYKYITVQSVVFRLQQLYCHGNVGRNLTPAGLS